MEKNRTALVLVGFQNEWFAPTGVLNEVFEDKSHVERMIKNVLRLVTQLQHTDVPIVSTPIVFTPDYRELLDPVGILKTIRDVKAFQHGTMGSELIPELKSFGDRIIEVSGKKGMDAFLNTKLDKVLKERGISRVCLAGVVTSLCIDSTGRGAYEQGYRVTILSDCTSGYSAFEQEFYCEKIFPLYADVLNSHQLLETLGIEEPSEAVMG
jgi:nicotinamidase-related amidase